MLGASINNVEHLASTQVWIEKYMRTIPPFILENS